MTSVGPTDRMTSAMSLFRARSSQTSDAMVSSATLRPAAVDAAGGSSKGRTWPRLRIVPDAFEQELLTDITEAEALGEGELAAEWRLELKIYRAAKKQGILEDQAGSDSSAVARRETLGSRRSDRR